MKTDGAIQYLSDWESRRLAYQYSNVDDRFKFNLMRVCLPDVLFYGILVALAVCAVRRGRRIRTLEEITRDRLSKLATLCVREKEERGRFPLFLDELKGVEKEELCDAVTRRPFLCLTSVNDRFLVASPRSWFSEFFLLSFQKRYFVGYADGSVRIIIGSVCAKTAEKVFARLVRLAKENDSNLLGDISHRADELSKSLDRMTTLCRRSLVFFIMISQALFWLYLQHYWFFLGLSTFKAKKDSGWFDPWIMFIPSICFELPLFATWLVSIWKTVELGRLKDPQISLLTHRVITALVILNVVSLYVLPGFSSSLMTPWKGFSWRVA